MSWDGFNHEDKRMLTTTKHPRCLSTDTISGDAVKNRAGDDLGEIKELMIDVVSGRVAYAVLSFGGFLGLGNKLFALPWSALELDAANKCFILDVTKEQLTKAPGFDKDNWPDFASAQFHKDTYAYYGSKPYWN